MTNFETNENIYCFLEELYSFCTISQERKELLKTNFKWTEMNNMKMQRKKLGLTQKKLAEKRGMKLQAIHA